MRKPVMILCAVLLIAALLVGCTPSKDNTPDPRATGMYLTYHEQTLKLGMRFADVKDGMGAETSPSQEILPCDGSDLYKDTMYFYGGLAVTVDREGIVKEIDADPMYEGEGDAALMGKVKVGDKTDDAIKALGEPDAPLADDDYALIYTRGNSIVYVFLNPDDGKATVRGVSLMLFEVG